MCIFSGPVQEVSGTKIFGRLSGTHQFLAYNMTLSGDESVSMILPIPVKPGYGDDAVSFIDLSEYSELFTDLHRPFAGKGVLTRTKGFDSDSISFGIKVHDVGSFNASFLPTLDRMDELDPRFRLPRKVWDQMPRYEQKKYGFVVFKFKTVGSPAHPMAFSFPTANSNVVYFPTTHVHDGHEVEEASHFDHELYLQVDNNQRSTLDREWFNSVRFAQEYVTVPRAKGLVHAQQPLSYRSMSGTYRNADVLVSVA